MDPSERLYMEVRRLSPGSFGCFQEQAEILGKIFVEAFNAPVSSELSDIYPDQYPDPTNLQLRMFVQQRLYSEWLNITSKICSGVTTLDSRGNGNVPVAAIHVVTMHTTHGGAIVGFCIFYEVASDFLVHEEMLAGSITVPQQDVLLKTYTGTGEIYIDPIAVLPAFQGYGVGRQLLTIIRFLCPWVDHHYLATSASKTNQKAQGFYERHGFVPWIRYSDTAGLQSIVYSLCLQQPLHMNDLSYLRSNDVSTNGGVRR